MQGFDFSRALIGLQCIGTAQQTVDETWEYVVAAGGLRPAAVARTRASRSRWPRPRRCSTAARLLCYQTLWLKDAGLPHTTEAAMCKWWAPKTAYDVINQCLLLHGQYGYRTELPIEQRLRDVLGLQIGDGTAQIMKLSSPGRSSAASSPRDDPQRGAPPWESWTTRSRSSPAPGRASAAASPRSSPPRAPPSSSPTSTRPAAKETARGTRRRRRRHPGRRHLAGVGRRDGRAGHRAVRPDRRAGQQRRLGQGRPVRRLRPGRLGPRHRDQPLRRPATPPRRCCRSWPSRARARW